MNYYITFCDEKYLIHAEKLFELINKYSKHKLIVFTINFKYESKFEKIIPICFENKETSFIERMFMKPFFCKKVLELFPNDTFCFLDADIIPLPNCDEIFDDHNIEYFPLITRQCYDYIFFNNMDVDPEYERNLFAYLNLDRSKRDSIYRQTCVFLFNNKCYDFIKKWCEICQDEHVLNYYKIYSPVYDETVANILIWGSNYTNYLGRVHIDMINREGDNFVEFLSFLFKHPKEEILYKDFCRIPSESEFHKVKFLHGKMDKKQFEFLKAFFIFNY